MPLARWAVYQGGPQLWLALTADDSDGWIASVRHIAIEAARSSSAFRSTSRPRRSHPTSRSPFPTASRFGRGGACIVAPTGDLIAGPEYGTEAMLVADCDLRDTLHAEAVLRRRRPLQPRRRADTADTHAAVALKVGPHDEEEHVERLGIEPISVFGMPPVPYIELAADLGLRYIAIMLTAMPNSYGYPPFSLRDDRELRRHTLAALHDREVSIALGEGMVVREDTDMRDLAIDIAVMGELGAQRVNTMSFDPDRNRTIDRFGAVAELAAAAGMETTFEFGPTKPVGRTLPEGVEIIRAVGRQDSGSSSTPCTSSARAPERRTSRHSTRSSSGTSNSPTRRSSPPSRTTWRRRASSAWFRERASCLWSTSWRPYPQRSSSGSRYRFVRRRIWGSDHTNASVGASRRLATSSH